MATNLGWFPNNYYSQNYWSDNYWTDNYFPVAPVPGVTGWFPKHYFSKNYFHDDYWQDSPIPSADLYTLAILDGFNIGDSTAHFLRVVVKFFRRMGQGRFFILPTGPIPASVLRW